MFTILFEDQGENQVDPQERFRAFVGGDEDGGAHGYGPTPNQAVEDLLPLLANAGLSGDRKDYEVLPAPAEDTIEEEY